MPQELWLTEIEGFLIDNGYIKESWLQQDEGGKDKSSIEETFLTLFKTALIIQPNHRKDQEMWKSYVSQITMLNKKIAVLQKADCINDNDFNESDAAAAVKDKLQYLKILVDDKRTVLADAIKRQCSKAPADEYPILWGLVDDTTLAPSVFHKASQELLELMDYYRQKEWQMAKTLPDAQETRSIDEIVKTLRHLSTSFFHQDEINKVFDRSNFTALRQDHETRIKGNRSKCRDFIRERCEKLAALESGCKEKASDVQLQIDLNQNTIEKLKSDLEKKVSIRILLP